jgi:MFS family permease
MDTNAANSVLYALSTIAQTCAALAAFVGALALFRLQAMLNAHDEQQQIIRGRVARATITNPPAGLSDAVAEFDAHDDRYATAVNWFIGFEVWNLSAILVSLLGFAWVSWLAWHWWVFVVSLVVCSIGTVAVTALALASVARGYVPWADRLIKKISQRFSQLRARLSRRRQVNC